MIRSDYAKLSSNSQVALLAGGGSGHEPAHLGFIGEGMLTGVVCGHLFASPSTAAILAAIKFVGLSNKAGVLLIVKNYTGDRLNFGLAAKRAQIQGINVDWILVDDDVALLGNGESKRDDVVGSRGLCGTILVEKLAGAMAEQGKSLSEIKNNLEEVLNENYLRTLGVSLSGRVTLPGETAPLKTPEVNALIEVGLGIHGETGRKNMPLCKSSELAELVLKEYILRPVEYPLKDICLMFNNLGGLSNLELYLYANDCIKYIHNKRYDLRIRRLYCGTFMTSLNMNGFSVSALYLESNKVEMNLNLLDASTDAPSWSKSYGKDIKPFEYTSQGLFNLKSTESDCYDLDLFIKFENETRYMGEMVKTFLQVISQDLIGMKDYLNKLDSGCGDGDCGDSLKNISQVILKDIEIGNFEKFEYPHKVFMHMSDILENGGGSLCILLALFFSASAKSFSLEKKIEDTPNTQLHWLKILLNGLTYGIAAVQEYGRAKPNQRSIIDPLMTIKISLNDYIESVEKSIAKEVNTSALLKIIVDNTLLSAESTAKMIPKVGRASYVDASTINTPDAGAMAISSVLSSVYKVYIKANH